MALFACELFSTAMNMATQVRVILPDTCEMAEAEVLYLLHGLSDNCTAWTRYTSVERYIRGRNLAVVMPEVQRSWYCDMKHGLPYFTYLSQELPRQMQRYFGLSREKEKNYIAGLSMGGFGALKTALTYPERYTAVGSFSGALDLKAMLEMQKTNPQRMGEAAAIFGPELTVAPENDLRKLLKQPNLLPKIYLSCGEEDYLYDINQKFHGYLNENGIPHRYDHRPGDHRWDFWDRSIQDFLEYIK